MLGSLETGDRVGNEILSVTVIVRPRKTAPAPLTEQQIYDLGRRPLVGRHHVSLHEYRERYGADRRDLEAVKRYACKNSYKNSVRCVSESVPLRSVVLEGTASDLSAAFGAKLAYYTEAEGNPYLGRRGYLRVPNSLTKIIEAVHGFDGRPAPRMKVPPKPDPPPSSVFPRTVARHYDFPSRHDGTGQRIAIIAAGGYRPDELATYFRSIRRPMPRITPVGVHGTRNLPGRSKDDDTELMLDLEVIGSIVPGAELLVYLAPHPRSGMGGWIEAVRAAVFDRQELSVISISWGLPEDEWTAGQRAQMDQAFQAAAALGITVCCASGDWGSKEGFQSRQPYVNYPASSPYVLACGGTKIVTAEGEGTREQVWNDRDGWASGGGMSKSYKVPGWQAKAVEGVESINIPPRKGRGVPDVAGLAEPRYTIGIPGGYLEAHGGTSAVAPLWAALIAQLNQRLGKDKRAGYLNPLLYEAIAPTGFNSILEGTNGGYHARHGWDACTGLGSPKGEELLRALETST